MIFNLLDYQIMNRDTQMSSKSDAEVDEKVEVEEVEVVDFVEPDVQPVVDDWCTPVGGVVVDSKEELGTLYHILLSLTYSQDPLRKRLNWIVQIQMNVILVMTPEMPPPYPTRLVGVTSPLPVIYLVLVVGAVPPQIPHGNHLLKKVWFVHFVSFLTLF